MAYLAENKHLYIVFVEQEKAFNRVPRDDILLEMCKLGIDKWLVPCVRTLEAD